MYRFGVDEAGKGPVFGSMFAAAVWVDDHDVLPAGVADSKTLTATRREELATTLREDDRVHVGVAELSTDRIDDPATDMNSLTVATHAQAIDDVLVDIDSEDPSHGLCDACDTDSERFARRVATHCTAAATIDACHGADETSPLVGAASIIAKVERDAHIASIAAEYGEIGSGYPSDQTTQAFLESYVDEHGTLPPFARRSWTTCQRVLEAASQTGLDEF